MNRFVRPPGAGPGRLTVMVLVVLVVALVLVVAVAMVAVVVDVAAVMMVEWEGGATRWRHQAESVERAAALAPQPLRFLRAIDEGRENMRRNGGAKLWSRHRRHSGR